ncbi:MAG: hypothetical protein J6B10_03020 [Lachnospiraceae bacterium]|nr:hypothetical protein [Lachnospiraceae bacterium]
MNSSTASGNIAKAVIQILNPASATGLRKRQPERGSQFSECTRNALENGAGFGMQDNNSEAGRFEVQYNPSTLRISEQVSEQAGNAADGLSMEKNIGGNCTRSVSVDLVFYRQSDMAEDSVRKRIETFLALMMKSPDRRISFSWGKMECVGCVTSVSASYEMFDEAGNPLFGTVKLSVQEEMERMGKAFEKADAPRKDRLRSAEDRI